MKCGVSIFLISLFCILQQPLFSQKARIDSLTLTLEKLSVRDSNRVKTLNQLSEQLWRTNKLADSRKYAEEALTLAQELNFYIGAATSFKHLGTIFSRQGKVDDALKYLSQAINLAKKSNDKYLIASIKTNIGIVYYQKGKLAEALKEYSEVEKLCQEIGEKRILAYCYGNMGLIYQRQGEYAEALDKYFDCLRISLKIGDKNSIGNSYNQIGIIHKKLGNNADAISYFTQAVDVSQEIGDMAGVATTYCNIAAIHADNRNFEEALRLYFLSIKIRNESGDKHGMASSYSNVGLIYKELGNYDEAIRYFQLCLGLTKETRDNTGTAVVYNSLGSFYFKQMKYSEARKYLDSAISLAISIGDREALRNAYGFSSDLDSAIGDYGAAYKTFKRFYALNDSLVGVNNIKKALQSELQFKFSKKEDSLKYNQELAEEKLKQQVLIANQQKQALLLNENLLTIANRDKEIQNLAFGKQEAELQVEQALRKSHENSLQLAEQNKMLQESQLTIKDAKLKIQDKELQVGNNQKMLFIAGIASLMIVSFLLYRNFQNQRRINRLQLLNAQREKSELQLQSLRAQLNPHFMFNSLNAIQELILKQENEKSQSYLERFAQLLRSMLENANQPFIPLRKEIDFLKLYLSLEQLRIPDLQYSINIDPSIDLDKIQTPNMMLQPYLENALWHGLQYKTGEKKLELNITKGNGSLNFLVKDNGIGRKKASELKSVFQKAHKSKGMELLSKRFSLLSKEYGDNITTDISDISEKGESAGTAVLISVPNSLTHQRETVAS